MSGQDYWKDATERQERATNSGHATCHKRIAQLEAELAELRLETIAATGQAQTALEENARLKRQHREEIFNAVQQAERPIMAKLAELEAAAGHWPQWCEELQEKLLRR
jgi:regulator of replication initiation timing